MNGAAEPPKALDLWDGPIVYVNWEYRPSILVEDRAFAILAKGEDWTEVSRFEVEDSGRAMTRERFAEWFGDLPPVIVHRSQR